MATRFITLSNWLNMRLYSISRDRGIPANSLIQIALDRFFVDLDANPGILYTAKDKQEGK